uniref:Uncharacterized protein n=1 Tax=Arundo donax TaxID=35708 RepID=A0A0A9C053_ARUDO
MKLSQANKFLTTPGSKVITS